MYPNKVLPWCWHNLGLLHNSKSSGNHDSTVVTFDLFADVWLRSLLWSQVALLKTGTGFTWKGSDQLFESSTMWFRTWLTALEDNRADFKPDVWYIRQSAPPPTETRGSQWEQADSWSDKHSYLSCNIVAHFYSTALQALRAPWGISDLLSTSIHNLNLAYNAAVTSKTRYQLCHVPRGYTSGTKAELVFAGVK